MNTAAKLLKQHQPHIPKDGPVPNRRVLVIDDEVEIAEGVRKILSPAAAGITSAPVRSSRALKLVEPNVAPAAEFDVAVVHTPADALTAVRQALADGHPFAMGFFDVKLNADIDGIELVRQVFQLDPDLFAVFVTAYQDRSVDAIAQVVGEENRERWDYINKPFSEGEILQKARNATSLWDLHRLKEWQEGRLSEAHQLLLQLEKQNSIAAVGRSVAHEFGNLLTHIVGNAELALEKGDSGGMKSALELILKASDTAANILKRFRAMHGSAEKPTAPSLVDVWQTLEEALELMEFQFRKRRIQVHRAPGPVALIKGYRHELVQVFVNLFTNGMYVMPKGGDFHLAVSVEPGWVQISIRDTGPGIPDDILPKVTQALFTTKGAEGTGLGLAICKEIVEVDHDGELVVRNHPQGGAEVLVRLRELKTGKMP